MAGQEYMIMPVDSFKVWSIGSVRKALACDPRFETASGLEQ